MRRHAFFVRIILFIILSLSFETHAQKLTLEQAIEEAISHNPDILRAWQEVKAAKVGIWEGISPAYPEFFSHFAGVPKGQTWSNYRERKTGFAQKLDCPLSYLFRGQWYDSEESRVRAEYRLLRNDLTNAVKKQFYKVILLQNQRQLYEAMIHITRENFRKAHIRVISGESPAYDTLKVKVDLTELENNILAIQNEYNVARSELSLLMGREMGDVPDIKGNLYFAPVCWDLDSLQTKALTHHPLLHRAESNVKQKLAEKRTSWTDFFPEFQIKYFKHDLPKELSRNAWGGEVAFSIPLWFFLKGQGRIRSASYRLNAARWQLEAEKRRVLLEVDKAYTHLLIAEKQVKKYREGTLLEVEELVRIATRSYEEGEMGYLEVAEALRSLNRTKAGYARVLFDYLSAQADLEKAVGVSIKIEE